MYLFAYNTIGFFPPFECVMPPCKSLQPYTGNLKTKREKENTSEIDGPHFYRSCRIDFEVPAEYLYTL